MSPRVYQRRAQGVLAFVGLCLLSIGVGLHFAQAEETLLPGWWVWGFGLGAALVWTLALTLNRTILQITSVYIVVLFCARISATIDRAQNDQVQPGRILVSLGVYSMSAFLAAVVMVVVIAPLVAWKHQGRR